MPDDDDIDLQEDSRDGPGALRILSPVQREAVESAVMAVIEHRMQSIPGLCRWLGDRDPYEWCRSYGPWEEVHPIRPPGDVSEWNGSVYGQKGEWTIVDVDMYTVEEGQSDLTLSLELHNLDENTVQPVFKLLHVQ